MTVNVCVRLNMAQIKRGFSHFRSSPRGTADAHFLEKASLSVNVCNITFMQFTIPQQSHGHGNMNMAGGYAHFDY